MTEPPNKEELLRLLEMDYDRTNKFIEGVLSTIVTIRGWAITISLALLGVGFDRDLSQAALLAVVVTLLFAALDAYHSWLYTQAIDHTRSIEAILARYYASLVRGHIDADATEDFAVKLETHRFGLSANLSRFGWSKIGSLRPRFMVFLYIALLLVAAVAACLIQL